MIDRTTRAVIFDVDGTLVQSNDAHAAAWSRAFAGSGFFDVIPPLVRPLIGLSASDLIPELKPHVDQQTCAEIERRHAQIFQTDYLPKLRPTRGARELVEILTASGVDTIAVTSAAPQGLKRLLEAAHLSDLIRQCVTADDVAQAKPSPDAIEVALERLHCQRQNAVMVGDTIYDIEAARRARIGVIALRCGNTPERLLAQADAVFDDPLELATALQSLTWRHGAGSYAESA